MEINQESLETVFTAATGAALAIVAMYVGFRRGVKTMGDSIPGEDVFDMLDAKLTEKVDPIIGAIERGVDKLNPQTHGGAGSGPDVRPPDVG